MSQFLQIFHTFRLFQNGVDIDVQKLYPPIAFPVSRGTPMISPIIKWDHSQNYVVPFFDSYNFYEKRNLTINLSDKLFEFVSGHIIDGDNLKVVDLNFFQILSHFLGKVLFPGTGWLYLIWETFSLMHGVPQMKLKVAIEDVKFLRATSLQKNQDITVTIAIHRGNFAVSHFLKTRRVPQCIRALFRMIWGREQQRSLFFVQNISSTTP